MDRQGFWALIDAARAAAADPDDGAAVVEHATALLAARPRDEVVAAQQAFWDLMGDSYRSPLWAAAYLINGGCSDDGFEYFRGWLITQGRKAFEQAVADPDSLAALPAVQAAARERIDLDCEEALSIAWDAHRKAFGEEPPGSFTISYADTGPFWDFDDDAEMSRRLPRLTALYDD